MPDSIQIPFPSGSPLMWMTVCGKLKEPLETIDRASALFVHTEGDARVFVRVLLGAHGDHIHVDIYHPDALSRGPDKRGDSEEVLARIIACFGQEMDADISGGFIVRPSRLPKEGIIRASMFKTEIGSIRVAQTGATFVFSAGPVREIEWEFDSPEEDQRDEEELSIRVRILVPSIVTLGPDYLMRARTRLLDAFNVTVLGKAD